MRELLQQVVSVAERGLVGSWVICHKAATVGALCLTLIGCDTPFDGEYEKFRAIKKGMTEAEVIEHLGEPDRIYTKEDAPKDYYVEGWSHEEREIRGKVLIFIGTEPIAYVYLDPDGVVEHVFVGGS